MFNLQHSPDVQFHAMPEGKQRLIRAALRVAAREGVTLHRLSLRELAREAELNHNTFYRHFDNLDQLALATIGTIASEVMQGVRDIRLQTQRHVDATVAVADYYFDLVLQHADAFVVGVRELHSHGSSIRPLLLHVLDDIAKESVKQLTEFPLLPLSDPDQLFLVARDISQTMFCRSIDAVAQPGLKSQWVANMSTFIRRQFLGQMMLAQIPHSES